MEKFLIDVNLPYYFGLWNTKDYIHQIDIDPKASDRELWKYARKKNLTIITKDSDFSNRMMVSEPPPKVIHIKFGNIKMRDFHANIRESWDKVLEMNVVYKLINVYKDRIEGIQ